MDEILIANYDPDWPAKFEAEAARLRAAFSRSRETSELITRIEHIGSTAVPGLAAKPIIDLLVGVASLDDARVKAVPVLAEMGYAYWHDNPDDAAHMFFVKGLPPSAPQRTHHIHMVEPGSPFWERLQFRDYLRVHPADRDAYAALKRDLAARFADDREAYTDAKTEFIKAIMEKAQKAASK